MVYNYCIKIRQEADNRLEKLCSWFPYDIFNIELDFLYVSPLNLDTTLKTIHQSVIYPRRMFLSRDYGPNMVLSLFADTDAPLDFLRTILHDILVYAFKADADSVNLGRKVIKLIVEVLVVEPDEDDDYDQAVDESLSKLNFKPASRASIQTLKRVKLGDDGPLLPLKKRRKLDCLSSKKQCTICLDEFSDGEELVWMPCGHVYHNHCIVTWLETSHLCPLCRFQMPS
ncbi:Zinc finger, RING-type [Corchorus capsularis]|uniref:RING-type E3 ubiquitin transferase n=1 Tax=Corchorus capsularis TaxID=210143 RepID=A0A1R3IYR1_COCAP|nr:Zinc finger, RING-type [Corchorus capsularis]